MIPLRLYHLNPKPAPLPDASALISPTEVDRRWRLAKGTCRRACLAGDVPCAIRRSNRGRAQGEVFLVRVADAERVWGVR